MGRKAPAKRGKPTHVNRTAVLTVSCDDYERLLKIFGEIGGELGRFRKELLSHQNRVRRIMMDAGGDGQ